MTLLRIFNAKDAEYAEKIKCRYFSVFGVKFAQLKKTKPVSMRQAWFLNQLTIV